MLNVEKPLDVLKELSVGGMMPDVVELHRAIDVELEERHAWGDMAEIKRMGGKMLVAVAGGIKEDTAPEAINGGADIIIVGRGITNSKDVEGVSRRFLRLLKEEIDQYRVMTDF
jgi:bifunctional enzyme Fae/Hps